jgi:hypothetical protein
LQQLEVATAFLAPVKLEQLEAATASAPPAKLPRLQAATAFLAPVKLEQLEAATASLSLAKLQQQQAARHLHHHQLEAATASSSDAVGTNAVDQQPIGSQNPKGEERNENSTPTRPLLTTPVKRDIAELYGDTDDFQQSRAEHKKNTRSPPSAYGDESSAAPKTTCSVTRTENAANAKQDSNVTESNDNGTSTRPPLADLATLDIAERYDDADDFQQRKAELEKNASSFPSYGFGDTPSAAPHATCSGTNIENAADAKPKADYQYSKDAESNDNGTSTRSLLATSAKRDITELYDDTDDYQQSEVGHEKNTSLSSSAYGDTSSAAPQATFSLSGIDNAADAKPKAALLQAKVKLKKAILAKMRALEQKRAVEVARKQAADVIRPINALLKGGLDSLFIRGIRGSGPVEKVCFATTAFLVSDPEPNKNDVIGGESHVHDANLSTEVKAASVDEIARSKRRLELKQKLIEAKEKKQRLEVAAKQQRQQYQRPNENETLRMNSEHQVSLSAVITSSTTGDAELSAASAVSSQFSDAEEDVIVEDQKPAHKPSRAELLKRKKEAERNRAVVYFKHLLSKQERLKAYQDSEAQKTAANLEECTKEMTQVKAELEAKGQSIQSLSVRKEILDELLAERVSELVKKRKHLHDCRDKRSLQNKG